MGAYSLESSFSGSPRGGSPKPPKNPRFWLCARLGGLGFSQKVTFWGPKVKTQGESVQKRPPKKGCFWGVRRPHFGSFLLEEKRCKAPLVPVFLQKSRVPRSVFYTVSLMLRRGRAVWVRFFSQVLVDGFAGFGNSFFDFRR